MAPDTPSATKGKVGRNLLIDVPNILGARSQKEGQSMINLRRILMLSAALSAITMQGCGCDGDEEQHPSLQSEQTFTVSGSASKGILRNFEVSAHPFVIGGFNPIPIASSYTNNLGAYTLTIPEAFRGQPLLYRVHPRDSGSIMTCDLADGCGEGVAFGDDLPVTDTSFTLDSVVPSADHDQVANISMFTDLASGLTLRALGETNNGNVDAIRSEIARANSKVADRFGLSGDLYSLPVIDLTNEAAMRAASDAGNTHLIQYAAINAAIAQAAGADSDDGIFSAMDSFKNDFVGRGIPANSDMDSVTSYAEVLNAAQRILLEVRDRNPEAPLNAANLLQNLIAEEALAKSGQPDMPDQGTPSEASSNSPLKKVKAMVTDLRNLAVSFGDVSASGATINNLADDFAMQLEAAKMVSSNESRHLLKAMYIAAKAVDDARNVHSRQPKRTSYTSVEGIAVRISAVGTSVRFSVNQNIKVPRGKGTVPVSVKLVATNALTNDNERENLTLEGRYDVTGSATGPKLKLEVKDGSSMVISNVEVTEEIDEESANVISTETLDAFEVNFHAEMSQLPIGAVSNPIIAKGALSASLSGVRVVEEAGNATLSVGIVSLRLSGIVGDNTGDSASFVAALTGDGTGVSFVDNWVSARSIFTGETEENYVGLHGNVAFTAKLTGNPNTVVLNFAVARTGRTDLEHTLSIRYPGKQFRFQMLGEDGAPEGALTITNQDGVVMSLVVADVGREKRLTGTISLNGIQYANIEHKLTILIHFLDNTFESL